MATVAFNAKVNQELNGSGVYATSLVGRSAPTPDVTAVNAAITTALAIPAISGDQDATDAVTAIQDAVDALVSAIQSGAGVSVTIDTSAIDSWNKFHSAMREVELAMRGASIF